MTASSSVRPIAFQLLLLLLPSVAIAQTTADYCEPSAAVKAELENKYSFPVLLGHAYAEQQGANSIPRNWVVAVDGKIMFEGVGFGNDGEEWMKKAAQAIEKVKGTN